MVDVPDLFAIVIGPSSLIVDGDVIFAGHLDIPAVEKTIMYCIAALREHRPSPVHPGRLAARNDPAPITP